MAEYGTMRVKSGLAEMLKGGVIMDVVDADPAKIREIQEAVTIPVMAKCRIGHFAEAQILEALEVDYIDESEVLTPADLEHHVDKWRFTVPFVCGATNLGEALRRISEGAAMIRTKGEGGAGGIATPADASLCMQLGADGVFVGSGIFKSGDPERRAKAIVEATTHYNDPDILARVSAGLGEPMVGVSAQTLDPSELLETRGW